MAGRPIDNWTVGNVFAVMDHDSPDVDERKEADVCQLLQRENEGENVVRQALGKAIERVESVARKRGRHDPFVVWLMERLVQAGVMQTTVDPVDKEVGEEEEEGKLEGVVKREGRLSQSVVEFRIPPYLSREKRACQDRHYGHRDEGLLHLQLHLVFEVFRVLEVVVVEYEEK